MRHGTSAPTGAGSRLWAARLLLALLAALVLVLRARTFLPYICDDALISLRYADRLLSGQGLNWTDGQPVEGYSNLLWVLVVALGGLVSGADLIPVAWTLGTLAMVAACVAPLALPSARSGRGLVAAAAASLALALSAPLAVWAVGGLEQALLAALLAWGVVLGLRLGTSAPPSRGALAGVSLVLGLMCLTRPDGLLLALALCAALLLGAWTERSSVKPRQVLALLALPVLFLGAQLVFRLAYYGDWVPNTKYAKLHFTGHRLATGWEYLSSAVGTVPLLGAGLVTMLALLGTPRWRHGLAFLLPAVGWVAYVIAIGGDIFPAHRHLVPVLLLCGLGVAELGAWLAGLGKVLFAVGLLWAAILTLGGLQLERTDDEIRRAHYETWIWEGQVLGALLRTAFADSAPLVAVDAAGTVPYFSRLPALDMLGLNDRFIATHPPADLGQGWIGHELGNGDYVLDREPDILIFCRPRGRNRPCHRSGEELEVDPRFQRDYVFVALADGPGLEPSSYLWFRKEGRIGIARAAHEVRIPGFLFTGPRVHALPIADGRRLAALVGERRPARLEGVSLAAGAWRVAAESEPAVHVRLLRSADGATLGAGDGSLSLDLAEPTFVDLELLAPPGAKALVEGVRLEPR